MLEPNPYLTVLYRRVFSSRDPGLVQLSFDAGVLDRYRGARGFSLIRTDTAGRLRKEGDWAIDLGIGDDEGTVHASLRDVLDVLPEDEREHWARHVAALPMSERFLQMRLAGGACIDDGEVREWE